MTQAGLKVPLLSGRLPYRYAIGRSIAAKFYCSFCSARNVIS